MALTLAFFVKHIRPADLSATNVIAGYPEVIEFMSRAFGGQDKVLRYWVSMLTLLQEGNSKQIAESVADARWSELGPTTFSTVVFLTGSDLKTLITVSDSCGVPNQTWTNTFSDMLSGIKVGPGNSIVPIQGTQLKIGNDGFGNGNHFAGFS